MPQINLKTILTWALIAGLLAMAFNGLNMPSSAQEVDYSTFIAEVRDDNVSQVVFDGVKIEGTRRSGEKFLVVRPNVSDPGLMDDLLRHGVTIKGEEPRQPSILLQLLLASFPILLIVGIFMMMTRQGMNSRGGPLSFGKSKARLMSENQIRTTFKDVAGVDEAKQDLEEVVGFLRDPGRFEKLGGSIPRGLLMVGPPGTGKTLLARAVAGEARVPFFSISGSDFVEMFVGVGASRVRDMFDQAKKRAPCIVFIDEIDAVGRHRGNSYGGGNDEREQTLNQLLVEMDGFEGNEGIIVIAATNRPDVLDRALLRPGRFDRQVHVGLPDIRGREQILATHARKVTLDEDVDLAVIARGTSGFSGADLANLINEAALVAARFRRKAVGMAEFERARDKILMGAERKSMVMSLAEKTTTAYHEAGHAIVGWLMPEHDPIHKVSIIPRGRALGVTQFLPESDKYSLSRRAILGQICSLFGGRIAEEHIGGSDGVTTGASNDIERATQLARNMVTKWGLSDKLGPLNYGDEDERNPAGGKNYAARTADIIDKEVRSIMDNCYERASGILREYADVLEAMKEALLEYETIDNDQVDDLMNRRKVRPPRDWGQGLGSSGGGKSDKKASDKSVQGESAGAC